jgi:hypothetical protein
MRTAFANWSGDAAIGGRAARVCKIHRASSQGARVGFLNLCHSLLLCVVERVVAVSVGVVAVAAVAVVTGAERQNVRHGHGLPSAALRAASPSGRASAIRGGGIIVVVAAAVVASVELWVPELPVKKVLVQAPGSQFGVVGPSAR